MDVFVPILELAEAEENWQAEHPSEKGSVYVNEFKERFIQWFENQALFLEEAQDMDPIRDQFENFEKE